MPKKALQQSFKRGRPCKRVTAMCLCMLPNDFNIFLLEGFTFSLPHHVCSKMSLLCRPQPYSSRHDTFLQRYVQSGQPHILNNVRPVVALHKDRHAFPISLCVSRLSGVGADALFIGVMRHEPASGTADHQLMKVSCELTVNTVLRHIHGSTPARACANFKERN